MDLTTSELLVDAKRSQLLLIDVQERLVPTIDQKILESMQQQIILLLQAADLLNIPVGYSEQYPKGLGPTIPVLKNALPQQVQKMEKTSFSCCTTEGLDTFLTQGPNQILIMGIESHVCVLQTAMELHSMGKQVFIIEDAICASHKRNHKNAIARMRQAGISITNMMSVMFEWMRDSNHPQFRAISKLLR